VVVRHEHRTKFARVKLPPGLPRFILVPTAPTPASPASHSPSSKTSSHESGELFPGVEVRGAHLFRVIRDTDMEINDDGETDLLESVDRTLKQLRHGALSLLQVEASMPARVLNILRENFEIEDEGVVTRTDSRLDFSEWMSLHRLPLPHLKDPPFTPRVLWAPAARSTNVFDEIREQDWFVHHPFDSFSAVETFLDQAASDPHVAGIKMTLYRIGANSPLVDLLIRAADVGKQVAVLVELKARFDERNNIQWANRLEEAGIHVVYGVANLKTHCKLCLVVRREAGGVRRYAHIGTGNYNRVTSQVYTDFGLFTANPRVLEDVSEVFNSLTGYSNRQEYGELLVAPVTLRPRMLGLIDREIAHARAGRAARIVIKNNAVTDPQINRAYRAIEAGVTSTSLSVACALRAGSRCERPHPGPSSSGGSSSTPGYVRERRRAGAVMGSADPMERNLTGGSRLSVDRGPRDAAHPRACARDLPPRVDRRSTAARVRPAGASARRVNAQQALSTLRRAHKPTRRDLRPPRRGLCP
jgi:polyphosphate kinase